MRNMGEFIPSVNPQKGSQAHYYGFMNWLFLQPHPRSAIMDSAYQSITVSLIRHVSFCSIHELLTLMTLISHALNSVIDPVPWLSTDSPHALCKPRLDCLSLMSCGGWP